MNIPVLVSVAAVVMITIEYSYSMQLPKTPHWWPRVILFNLLQVAASFLGPLTWDMWLPLFNLVDMSSQSLGLQVTFGYALVTFIYYWWHRARHNIPWLWQCFHQIHHSPVRIEVVTSFYKHPLEILLNGILSSFILFTLLGLSGVAAAGVVLITGLAELFYHWNIRTPYVLGFIFQRPESHRLHHKQNFHHKNYSDLPIWDILFGTFENPRAPVRKCGFGDQRELLLWEMLCFKNVESRANNDQN